MLRQEIGASASVIRASMRNFPTAVMGPIYDEEIDAHRALCPMRSQMRQMVELKSAQHPVEDPQQVALCENTSRGLEDIQKEISSSIGNTVIRDEGQPKPNVIDCAASAINEENTSVDGAMPKDDNAPNESILQRKTLSEEEGSVLEDDIVRSENIVLVQPPLDEKTSLCASSVGCEKPFVSEGEKVKETTFVVEELDSVDSATCENSPIDETIGLADGVVHEKTTQKEGKEMWNDAVLQDENCASAGEASATRETGPMTKVSSEKGQFDGDSSEIPVAGQAANSASCEEAGASQNPPENVRSVTVGLPYRPKSASKRNADKKRFAQKELPG